MESMAEDLAALTPCGESPDALLDGEVRKTNRSCYLDAVARIHQYIRAGDVFQVNLSRAGADRLRPDARPRAAVSASAQAQSGAIRGAGDLG